MHTLNFLIFSIAFFASATYACFVLPDIMDRRHDISTKIFAILTVILLIVLSCLGAENINKFKKYMHTPTAMDVYSGKTELRYTVQGEKVVDSVVVYKDTITQ